MANQFCQNLSKLISTSVTLPTSKDSGVRAVFDNVHILLAQAEHVVINITNLLALLFLLCSFLTPPSRQHHPGLCLGLGEQLLRALN